jgi:hypothetical protein
MISNGGAKNHISTSMTFSTVIFGIIIFSIKENREVAER